MEIKEWQVQHHWHCVASATLAELVSIRELHNQKSVKLKECKSWLNETLCIGTNTKVQGFLYLATKTSKRANFNKWMDEAVKELRLFIETLK